MTLSNTNKRTSRRAGTASSHGRNGPPDSSTAVLENLRVSLDLIVQTLELYGFRREKSSLNNTLQRWSLYVSEVAVDVERGVNAKLPGFLDNLGVAGTAGASIGWMKVVKYKLAAFCSLKLGSALPKRPFASVDNAGVLVGGAPMRFLRTMEKRAARDKLDGPDRIRWISLLSTLMNGVKKGCPRPDKTAVAVSAALSVASLVSPPSVKPRTGRMLWSDQLNENDHLSKKAVNPFINRFRLEMELIRTVDELFDGKEKPDWDQVEPFFPSTSSNYVNSIKKGGAVSALKSNPSLQSTFLDVAAPQVLTSSNKDRDQSENESLGVYQHLYPFTGKDFRSSFQKFFSRARKLALKEIPGVKPVGLSEALKVRTISKGPPLTYTVLRPLQKFLWSSLKNHTAFRLIGKPVDPLDVLDRMGQKGCAENQFFVSGDYSAATDEIEPWVSQVIVDRLCQNLELPSDVRALFHRALTQHIFDLTGREDEALRSALGAPFRRQRNGQLMGSIVSFPILCMANAALCRMACEIGADRKFTLADCPLLVNGDDCLFRTTMEGYKAWQDAGKIMGLSESIGKTFTSKSYLNINSESFLYLPDGKRTVMVVRDGVPVRRPQPYMAVPFVNWGLILGLKRSAGFGDEKEKMTGVFLVDDQGFAMRARELVEKAPEDMQSAVFKRFLNRHWDRLHQVRLPWYIPTRLGGIGLPIVRGTGAKTGVGSCANTMNFGPASYGILYGPSGLDLSCARWIAHNHLTDVVSSFTSPTWKVRGLVNRAIGLEPIVVEGSHARKLEHASHTLESLCTSYVFMTSSVATLLDDNPSEKGLFAIRANEGLWDQASRQPYHGWSLGELERMLATKKVVWPVVEREARLR